MTGRLLAAVGASLVVVLGAPFVGQLRGAIQRALPDQYRYIIAGIVLCSIAVALVAAIVRIRDRRVFRYRLLGIAVAGAAIYATATSTGNRDVDVVEQFHFVEYGVLTFLYYRIWRPRGDLTVLLFPVLAVIVVGTLDELLQWFVPARVGELHDLMLNVAAIGCGLLFSLGLDPPRGIIIAPDVRGRRALALAIVVVGVLVAAFVHIVHLGFDVAAGPGRTFRSRFDAASLQAAARERSRRWRDDPPVTLRRLSREDHYFAEALWHVQERNLAVTRGDPWAAWNENGILEMYFEPVLNVPSYIEPHGARWPDEQRADIASRVGSRQGTFASAAHPYPIYTWSPMIFWLVTTILLAIAVVICLAWRPRQASALSPSGAAGARHAR